MNEFLEWFDLSAILPNRLVAAFRAEGAAEEEGKDCWVPPHFCLPDSPRLGPERSEAGSKVVKRDVEHEEVLAGPIAAA